MNYESIFHRRSQLLVDILPYVSEETAFVLKGGTAINYFVQDMPRYSVDIDLIYLPILPREETLAAINESILRMARHIQSQLPGVKIALDNSKQVVLPKLIVRRQDCEVVIEVNPIFRGSVYPIEMQTLSPKAQEAFESFLIMPVASAADLYGGKFCAALTRQHPRDLFDVKYLFEHQGITNEIRQAFVVYLASDKRPIHELLAPNIKPDAAQQQLFDTEFKGMTTVDVNFQELSGMVKQLSVQLIKQLSSNEKQFLLSLAVGEPEWDKLPVRHLKELPAIQWKLLNIQKMESQKRKLAYHLLEESLENNVENVIQQTSILITKTSQPENTMNDLIQALSLNELLTRYVEMELKYTQLVNTKLDLLIHNPGERQNHMEQAQWHAKALYHFAAQAMQHPEVKQELEHLKGGRAPSLAQQGGFTAIRERISQQAWTLADKQALVAQLRLKAFHQSRDQTQERDRGGRTR